MEQYRISNNGAEAFLNTLNDTGVERIFLNPGIDLVPLMAAVAKYKESGRTAPQVILCADESVAVSAAHGCAMVSGRPQMVAVFEDVGILQGGGAIVNLKYGRMPVVLCSGANQTPNRLDWQKNPADQRRIVRDYVKWDYEVSPDEDVSTALREAFRIALAEPCGPVYLSLAPGVLSGPVGQRAVFVPEELGREAWIEPDERLLKRAAEALIGAKNPLIMASYAGRHHDSVALLVELAETLGARVITTDLRMNFPSTHPLCPGIDAIYGDSYDRYIGEADCLFLVDYDFPGPIQKSARPGPDATVIHIDREPLKNGLPLWGRPVDILIEGDSARLLPLINAAVVRSMREADRERFLERSRRVAEENRAVKDRWDTLASKNSGKRPLSAEWLCRCIDEAIDEDTILVHMLPSNADALSHQIRRSKPGTIFTWGNNAGSMGWPLGAALGAKLAAPDRIVVSLVGDGGFIYGCPVATLWGSAAHRAPFLTVIFNNRSYAIFRDVIRRFYDKDILDGNMGFDMGIDLKDLPDFAGIARACNAFGQTVENPAELPGALKTALSNVKGGRSAVLDVRI